MANERLCRIKGTAEVVALSIGLAGAALTSVGSDTEGESIVIRADPPAVPCPSITKRTGPFPCERADSSARSGIGHTTDGPEADPGLVRAQCEAAGVDVCDVDRAIHRETAMCLAEHVVFGEGNAYRASLVFDDEIGTLVWDVTDAADPETAGLVVVDAMSGDVLLTGRGPLPRP